MISLSRSRFRPRIFSKLADHSSEQVWRSVVPEWRFVVPAQQRRSVFHYSKIPSDPDALCSPEEQEEMSRKIPTGLDDEQVAERMRHIEIIKDTFPFLDKATKAIAEHFGSKKDKKQIVILADHNHNNPYHKYLASELSNIGINKFFSETALIGSAKEHVRSVRYPDPATREYRDISTVLVDADAIMLENLENAGVEVVHMDEKTNNRFGTLPELDSRNKSWLNSILKNMSTGLNAMMCGAFHIHELGNKYSGEKTTGIDRMLKDKGVKIEILHLIDPKITNLIMPGFVGIDTDRIRSPQFVRSSDNNLFLMPSSVNENMAYSQYLVLFYFKEMAKRGGITNPNEVDKFIMEHLLDFSQKLEKIVETGIIYFGDEHVDFDEKEAKNSGLENEAQEVMNVMSEACKYKSEMRRLENGRDRFTKGEVYQYKLRQASLMPGGLGVGC